jgi:hypothetical protein
VVQRQVLYLGEVNAAPHVVWCCSIAVFDEDRPAAAQVALCPEGRPAPELACEVVQVKLSGLQLRRPRQWGACWLAYEVLRANALGRQTLKARLRPLVPGLTPRAALEKLAAIHTVDGHLPTTDGRTLILGRYTEPEQEQRILLDRLRLTLPEQPPPRITSTLQARSAQPTL